MEPLESFDGIYKGDILVSLADNGPTSRLNGTIIKVHSFSNHRMRISYKGISGTECHSYHSKQFRKATPEEVEAYHAGVTNIDAIPKNDELKYTYGDTVTFKVGDITLEYKVCYEHLSTREEVNDKIFKLLGLNPHDFCNKHYGYETPRSSWWPTAKNRDYAALNRVIEALQKECDKFNAKNAEPVPNTGSKTHKFKVGDKVKVLSKDSQTYSKLVGKTCTIKSIETYPDFWYTLEEDPDVYVWEESRLELVTDTSAAPTELDLAYPYRIKTWEELLATPGCHLDTVGGIAGPDDAFTVSMKQYCGMPLSTCTPQSIPGAYFWLRTWMITENTFVNVNNVGTTQVLPDLKSSNVDNTLDSTVYKVRPVTASLHKARKSKLIF